MHRFLNVLFFYFNLSNPSGIAKHDLRAIRRFRWQIAAGALIQTNTTLFATFRIFLHFSWICFYGKNCFI